jgi:hypothetical protein
MCTMSGLPAVAMIALGLMTVTNSDSESGSSSQAVNDELDISLLNASLAAVSGEGTLLAYAVPGLNVVLGARVTVSITLGNRRTSPARIAGIQAQNMAVVVSSVDQNVVGMLSQVGSAVRPNVRRLASRIIDVMQTLRKRHQHYKEYSTSGAAHNPPTPNIAYMPIFFFRQSCKLRSALTGNRIIKRSC